MDRRGALFLTPFLLLGVAIFAPGLTAWAAEPTLDADSTATSPLDSGIALGDYVPSFYVRAVTGPLMNKSVCYVCRNGSRPVVVIFIRKLDSQLEPKLKSLLKNIDRVVDRNRAIGLRSFGVMLSEDPFRDVSTVQTFSFDNKVAMPLTVASTAVAAPSGQNIHPSAAVTVVLYRNRRVEEKFAFRTGEMQTDEVRNVINRVRKFAGEMVDAEPSEMTGD